MELHPAVVHFPIAFLFLSFSLYAVSLYYEEKKMRDFAFIVFVLAVAGIAGAVISGNLAEDDIIHTHDIHEAVELHERFGFISLWVFGILLGWAFFRKKTFKRMEFLAFIGAFLIGLGIMTYGAHLGGEMVYEQGVGVEPMENIQTNQLLLDKQKQSPQNEDDH